MSFTASVTSMQDDWSAVLARMERNIQESVNTVAVEIQGGAGDLAAKDTGSMAASVYVKTPTESSYAESSAEARGLNPRIVILPEVDEPAPGSAYVAVAAEHGIFNELGTVRTPARPFLGPAAEAVRDGLQRDIDQHLLDTSPRVADIHGGIPSAGHR